MELMVKIKRRETPEMAPVYREGEETKRGKPTWNQLQKKGIPIEVLGVPYGGHIEGRDSMGEAFHKDTDIVLNPGDTVPLTYYHGFGPDDPMALQTPPEIVGLAKYQGETPKGHVFVGLIDPTVPLGARLVDAVSKGKDLKASSGAIAHMVRMGQAGLIDHWPVVEMAVFDTNDWRQPANQLATVQAKREMDPETPGPFDSPQESGTSETGETVGGAVEGTKSDSTLREKTMEGENYTKEQLEAIVQDTAKKAAEMAVEEFLKKSPADNPEGGVKSAPAVIHGRGEVDAKKAYLHYVRTGEVLAGYKAPLQEGTTTEGGFLVPDDEYRQIIAKRDEASIVRQLGAMQLTTSRDKMNVPFEDTSLTKFAIVAEEGAISGAEEEPTFGQVGISIYKFTKLIKVSEELLEDDNANLEQFLTGAIGRAYADTENYYALIGTGTGQPQGVFVGGTAGLTLATNAAITPAEVVNLKYKLGQPYRDDGAAWVMKGSTEGYLRGLSGNQFQFRETPMATGARGMETLEGFPVFANSNVAAIGSNAKSLIYGNFRYYCMVTNKSIRIRRLTELYAGNGQVGILATVRFGGAVLLAEAFQYATHPV